MSLINLETSPAHPASGQSDVWLWDLWLLSFAFPALAAADELGVFKMLQTPCTLSEIQSRLSLPERSMVTLVALLTSLRFLDLSDGRYRISSSARELLLPDKDTYWGGMFLSSRKYPLYSEIYDALKGSPAKNLDPSKTPGNFVKQWKQQSFSEQAYQGFMASMQSHSAYPAKVLARLGAYEGATHLLDVGGGSGCFSIEALKHNPALRCTIVETSIAKPVTESYLKGSDRICVISHDMFQGPWPVRGDRVLLSNVLHDWDLEQNRVLLRNASQALDPGGLILIHEVLLSDSFEGPLPAALFSLVMLLRTEGRQYSKVEIATLLENCGFKDVTTQPAAHHYSLVSAKKK